MHYLLGRLITMLCKYKKIRTKKGIKYGYCTLLKKEVELFKCDCREKQYKSTNSSNIKKKPLKSSKISKLERNRYSILTNNLNICIICGKPKQELHEVYEGIYRNRSMEYGCVIPLCKEHHDLIHKNKEFKLYYKEKMESAFKQVYPDKNFLDLFYYKK